MHTLEKRIRQANAAGRQALIPFVTAGFPDPDRFESVLDELDAAGADIIEIGVPFSDPVADGPVVEAASVRTLADGMSLARLLALLRERAAKGRRLRAGLVLMGYVNPFLQYGVDRFAAEAAQVGVSGCIVPDLPLEEASLFREPLEKRGIALIPLVASNTGPDRMREYAAVSQGYVYVVSVLGVTGERQGLPPEVTATLIRARQSFPLPVALGFGLREPAQLADLPPEARPDAVIFGSALLRHLDTGGSINTFMEAWRPPADRPEPAVPRND